MEIFDLKRFRFENLITKEVFIAKTGISLHEINSIEKGDEPISSEFVNLFKKVFPEFSFSDYVVNVDLYSSKTVLDQIKEHNRERCRREEAIAKRDSERTERSLEKSLRLLFSEVEQYFGSNVDALNDFCLEAKEGFREEIRKNEFVTYFELVSDYCSRKSLLKRDAEAFLKNWTGSRHIY